MDTSSNNAEEFYNKIVIESYKQDWFLSMVERHLSI